MEYFNLSNEYSLFLELTIDWFINFFAAIATLTIGIWISGKIGKDHFGDIYLARVKQYGADSGLVQGDGTTGSSIILVTPDGERSMNTHLGMCREYSLDNIDVKKLSRSNYFYFTGYMWDTESLIFAILCPTYTQ